MLSLPSSSATIIDAVLNVEPGSMSASMALFLISLYTPLSSLCRFTIAFTSPVLTSMSMHTPNSASTSSTFSLRADSQISCIVTFMVVTRSNPFTASSRERSTSYDLICFLCRSPGCPLSTESNAHSSPDTAESLAANTPPIVLFAKVLNGWCLCILSSFTIPDL